MRLLILEDNYREAERIADSIRSAFTPVEIVTINTEHKFRSDIEDILKSPLDLAVIDALLAWTCAGPTMVPPPDDVVTGTFRRGGSRCASTLASDTRSRDVPVIVYSAADRSDLDLPPNVLYVQKDDDTKTLLRLIGSILQGAQMAQTLQSVFLVHGHDIEARETVARFIERLNLKPIILHEQANKGQTVIEKFEEHSSVPFAVVLLTPDDIGNSRADSANARPRARQNVILELGFFLGRLGRRNVCALYKSGVEIPSDYQGVIYIPMDSEGAWQGKLAREMRAAGLTIDLNRSL